MLKIRFNLDIFCNYLSNNGYTRPNTEQFDLTDPQYKQCNGNSVPPSEEDIKTSIYRKEFIRIVAPIIIRNIYILRP